MKFFAFLLTVILTLLVAMGANADAGPDYDTMKLINRVARQYGIDSQALVRIAHVESHFNQKAMRSNRNGTVDIGMFQVNSVHWDTTCQGIDIFTLEGNARCAALILKMHQKHAPKDRNWLGRYHSKTPSLKTKYMKLLKKVPVEKYSKKTLKFQAGLAE